MLGAQGRLSSTNRSIGSLALACGLLVCAAPTLASAKVASRRHSGAAEAAHLQRETVEQRIQTLHKDLGITTAEEADWQRVADVMRRNEAATKAMVAERRQVPMAGVTAVDDLVVYEKFNQLHVSGLRNLVEAFQTLYTSMPAAQKSVADKVFRGFGRERPIQG